MEALLKLYNSLHGFSVNRTIESILQRDEYKKLIPELVKDRLYKEGTYSDDSLISTYSAPQGEPYTFFTQSIKSEKGQPTDGVTLKDTGQFYNSFALNPAQDSFSIDYDEAKPDGDISDNVPFLETAVTLSQEDLSVLRTNILPDFINELKNRLSA